MGLEVFILVVILLTVATIAVPVFLKRTSINREEITRRKLVDVKKALVGDVNPIQEKGRTSFGFVGDVGVLPVDLTELIVRAAVRPLYGLDQNVWYGWRGPYIRDERIVPGDPGSAYVALVDAWGNGFRYTGGNWDKEIRSAGPDGIFDNGDDQFVSIVDDEVRTYLSGTFRDRLGDPLEESRVTIHFPNGVAALDSVQVTTGTSEPARTSYDSRTDAVSDELKRRVPIGVRYFQTADNPWQKLAALNGGALSPVNFVGEAPVGPVAPEFEFTFRPTDGEGDNLFESGDPDVDVYMGGGRAGVVNPDIETGGGYLTYGGFLQGWPPNTMVQRFGETWWTDYRLEANVLHGNGLKFGFFYRMKNLGYEPTEPDEDLRVQGSGYGFEFDPNNNWGDGDYAYSLPGFPNGGNGIARVRMRIWRYQTGSPRQLVTERTLTKNEFLSEFGYPILWRTHQLSITVQRTGDFTRHYVLINGRPAFTTPVITDETSGTACHEGYAGIIVQTATNFRLYHVLVHEVPPMLDGTYAWWSFEEGFERVANHVYGLGYEVGQDVLTGTLVNPDNVERQWQAENVHGQALYFNGGNGGYVNLGNIMDVEATGAFTVTTWVNAASSTPLQALVSKLNTVGWSLQLENNRISFTIGNVGEGDYLKVENTSGVVAGRWYHVAVTYDGSEFSGSTLIPASAVKIYVTEKDDAVVTASSTVPLEENLNAGINTVTGGSLNFGSRNNGTANFNGFIDEVRFYRRALSLAEVNEIFQEYK